MDLLHLVDRLEELVAGAQRMPIGSRAIVDRRRLLDIVDQMRVAIPDEVRICEDCQLPIQGIVHWCGQEPRCDDCRNKKLGLA